MERNMQWGHTNEFKEILQFNPNIAIPSKIFLLNMLINVLKVNPYTISLGMVVKNTMIYILAQKMKIIIVACMILQNQTKVIINTP